MNGLLVTASVNANGCRLSNTLVHHLHRDGLYGPVIPLDFRVAGMETLSSKLSSFQDLNNRYGPYGALVVTVAKNAMNMLLYAIAIFFASQSSP